MFMQGNITLVPLNFVLADSQCGLSGNCSTFKSKTEWLVNVKYKKIQNSVIAFFPTKYLH